MRIDSMFPQLKEVLLMVVGFVLSIIGALIGAWLQRLMDRKNARKPLNQLLNFGKDDLLFVFPHRTDHSLADQGVSALFPRTSTEDFMAMNNFITVLINIGW